MNITEVPFVKKVGIHKAADGESELPFSSDVQNHLQTICAGAQYTLAESSSAELLQSLFPELVGKVIPVIRETKIKYLDRC
jgi:hypothetical protein